MGSFGIKDRAQAQSNPVQRKEVLHNTVEVSKPNFVVIEAVEQISKPVFKIVDKIDIVSKPVYETTEIRHIVEIPKPELGKVNQSLADIQKKLEGLCSQVPMLPTVTTEVKEVLSAKALTVIITLSACNLVSLGVIAWLLS